MSGPAHTNRLAHETSPYLLQHAHNPVDWYPWGPEALSRAEAEDKPILLSIGYAACHWCHVMERESFENEDTARLMNERFVCIKVDREERPDLDDIYMAATVAMSGSGGWPMTVFLTPDEQRPFFAGTYFPPRDMHGRPGFPTLLLRITELWKTERAALGNQAAQLGDELAARARAAMPAAVTQTAIDSAVTQLALSFDPEHGGFGGAPKFPPAMSLELLLRHHRRTGDERSLLMARRTLDGMACGGMYDHVGGGFARYSTDERWLVPHFEKMLYDNALLSRVYAYAFQVTGEPSYRRVACETLDYILAEMTSAAGGFYSATDADSEGVEGKFFVWTPEELEAVLEPEQARAFAAYYDITPQGNWEGHSIANTPRALGAVAKTLGLEPDALRAQLEAARAKMYAARKERVAPLTDDKILTAWNALMLGTFAECGRIFDEPRYRQAAARCADFLIETMRRPDGGLYRTTRAGKTHLVAYLEDYAYLADALIDVYEAGMGDRYLGAAKATAERMIADFGDDGGSFFSTARDHERLLVRMRDGQDGPIPAANASAARALVRLSWHLGLEAWREIAVSALRAHGQMIERAPRAFSASLNALDMLLEGPVEAVLVGAVDDPSSHALAAALGAPFLPNRILVHVEPGKSSAAQAALLEGKGLVNGKPALYLCRNFACDRPITDASEVSTALAADRGRAVAGRTRRLGTRLSGRATPDGTARYRARHAGKLGEGAHRELGSTGLYAGRIAFGGYRVDDATPTFRDALETSLTSGCNLMDTSTNYTDGGSERLVGSVLAKLIARGQNARDEVIVVSKIGYVQGSNLALAKQRERESRPFPEMVKYADGCWHCIHPEWLSDQLERSLDRLGLDTLDVCLLHNPEYFFSDAVKRGRVDERVRDTFYARLTAAFAYLEGQVEAGRIGCYGVSSNNVAQAPDSPEATHLDRMLDAARAAGGEGHHFAVMQFPLNLIESEGALRPNLGARTVLELAHERNLGVLVNRPLNAIVDGGMLRLADARGPSGASPQGPLDELLARLRALEARFTAEIASKLPLKSGLDPDKLFPWGIELRRLDGKLSSLEQLEQLAHGEIIPRVSEALAAVERAVPGSLRDPWSEWRPAYIRAVEAVLAALRSQIVTKVRENIGRVRARIDPTLPDHRDASLQRTALWTLASTHGVSVVLLGMRRPEYVADAIASMGWAAHADPLATYRAIAGWRPSS